MDIGSGISVNDIHSKLNATDVTKVVMIETEADIAKEVEACARRCASLAVCGGRGAMGGQQFLHAAALIDMSEYNDVRKFDPVVGRISVQSGITWTKLCDFLIVQSPYAGIQWGINQKQTGADFMSIGGSVSANAHGRGLRFSPIVQDVVDFTIVQSDGAVTFCSRTHNHELFSLVVGGYGLFGVISEVTLQLAPRKRVKRTVELIRSSELPFKFSDRIASGYDYGDFQFSCDEKSDDFISRGVFSCYQPLPSGEGASAADGVENDNMALSENDWRHLITLAHEQKSKAFEVYSQFYLATSGQEYWSDTHQLSIYMNDYHDDIDKAFGVPCRGSEMITELYVPQERLEKFLEVARRDFIANNVHLIYGTIRLIKRDNDTYLPWAKQDYACVIFNLHVDHIQEGICKAQLDFQRLIDRALELGGSFFLTYHRWARKDQILNAYPNFVSFLKLKHKYDKSGVFSSDWYRHYVELFAAELSTEDALKGGCL